MKKSIAILGAVIIALIIAAGVALAGFGDKGEILGSTFSMGSADIKFVKDLAQGTAPDNLTDEITGPSFGNIGPNWSHNYALKIYNNAPAQVQLTSHADYLTANDPDELRQIIFVEPLSWTDTNNNGLVEDSEVGSSFGKKTIIKWKTEGYNFGVLGTGGLKGLVLRFSTESVSDTKQGKTAIFDFVFDSLGE